jgi:hypothetical protein
MSTRTTFRPQVVINAASMAANITSSPTILQSISGASYAISWAGTSPVGTLALQISNDYALNPDGSVLNTGTWIGVPVTVSGALSATMSVSGNTGTGFIDIQRHNGYATRLVYTAGSGTGSMTAVINGKVA